MLEIDTIKDQIEQRLGSTKDVTPIEKGFSSEKKYKVTAETGDYLIRVSPAASYARTNEKFGLMRSLHEQGVRCNQPVDLFKHEAQQTVYEMYRFLPGVDAEDGIAHVPIATQYAIGVEAGQDLQRINGLRRATSDWKARKAKKHERYVQQYFDQAYRFKHDRTVLRFIEMHFDPSDGDYLQHDDFHLGNVVIHDGRYGGVLDFDNYDWGDPLHEFVKLEWFSWPVSEAFAQGQVEGYFGTQHVDDETCLQLCVYLAMSILSTIVWTLNFHPHTWTYIENLTHSILKQYDYFDKVRPKWAL